MEQQNSTSTTSDNNILFNAEELDFESMDFKPVTDGLGFHHDEKKPQIIKPSVALKKSHDSSSPRQSSTVSGVTTDLGISNPSNQREINAHKSELSAFYGNTDKTVNKALPQQKFSQLRTEKSMELLEATKSLQFGAWLVDLILVSLSVLMTTALLAAVSGIDFRVLAKLVTIQDITVFTSSLFVLFYMLYFTVLDLASTPGKSLFGITLVKTNNKDVRVAQTFVRAAITLVSFLAIGLPSIIDFQGKLSDTKVVK